MVASLLTRDAEKRPSAEELLRRLGRLGKLRRASHWPGRPGRTAVETRDLQLVQREIS